MHVFDQSDYQANPGKYRLFTTAVIACDLPTQSRHQFPAGSFVRITHYADRANVARPGRPVEPIYRVSRDGAETSLFASALADFCL